MGIYKGLSASLLRQATYTTVRFGSYLKLKEAYSSFSGKEQPSLLMKILLSMVAGAGGAIAGSPADVVLVRMQADGKVPQHLRRGYKNGVNGIIRITREEGITALYRGVGPNVQRAMLMTAGQLASYDQAKQFLLQTSYFKDNIITHFSASFMAALVAAIVTSPFDVMKTRMMNGAKGTYKSTLHCFNTTLATEGPLAFYKGFMPYYIRLGPQTMITLIVYEQLCKLMDYMTQND